MMGALTCYLDFVEFGSRPARTSCWSWKDWCQEVCHTFEGFQLIIQAQMEESCKEENKAKFKHHIQDWETLERDQPQVLKVKCHKKAEAMSSEVHDLLAEMAAKKLHTQFDQRQRVQTGADMSFALTSAPNECGVHVGRDNHSHYQRQAGHNHRHQ